MIKFDNQPAIDSLVEMGYQPDIISLAMEESQNKSLEEVLDLLLFREGRYQKALKKSKEKGIQPKPKKKYSLEDQPKLSKIAKKAKKMTWNDSASDEDWMEEDLIDRENPVEVTKIGFGQLPKSVTLGKSKSEMKDTNKTSDFDIKEELPKEMNSEAASLLDGIIQNLKGNTFKDANVYINHLNDHLKTIRTDTTQANRTLQKYIVMNSTHSQIIELKNQVFAILTRILNMKIKKSITLEIKKLEQVVLWVFEMRLLSPKQLDSVITLFGKFCQRNLYPEDPLFESKLEKCYSDAEKQAPVIWRPDIDLKPEVNKEQPVEEKIKTNSDDPVEEKKINEVEEEEEDNSETTTKGTGEIADLPEGFTFVNHGKTRVVDDCIICMEKTREVVFLPCCHFLTCPLCSPRVMKCPMCNKRIDKHLKIQWS